MKYYIDDGTLQDEVSVQSSKAATELYFNKRIRLASKNSTYKIYYIAYVEI